MMPCDQRNKRRKDPISPSELPLDSIVEILSWLPVESLLRFKCVCKHWCSLIQDYQFVLKHVYRTNPMSLFYPCKSDENFEFVSSSTGLCMEKSVSNSRVFRVRNPATHQVLQLPDVPPHTRTVDFAIHSLTGECKVLCVYWEKTRKNIDSKIGFKVITVGIDEQWRPVELPEDPDQNKLSNKSVLRGCTTAVDKVEGVCHLLQTVRITNDEEECYMEVQSFDLWSESFTTNTVPQGVFSDFSKVGFVLRHNCLSICHTTEKAFNLWVLELRRLKLRSTNGART